MASLYLNDILSRNGIDPARTKLIRHSLKHKRFRRSYEQNFLNEYQQIQSRNFYNNCDYVLSFVSEPGTSAKFLGCYRVMGGESVHLSIMPEGFPVPEMFDSDDYYYNLQPVDLLSDLKGRLIIEWGRSAVSWHQWAKNEKAVLAIQTNPKYTFLGYESIILKYQELEEIVSDKILYENWHAALSSVYAIYLIVDSIDGKSYVGSAYGGGGLLGRWSSYIETKHGGNKSISELIYSYPERYKDFQFSILQILPKTITAEEVLEIENLYKRKLRTREFGLNSN